MIEISKDNEFVPRIRFFTPYLPCSVLYLVYPSRSFNFLRSHLLEHFIIAMLDKRIGNKVIIDGVTTKQYILIKILFDNDNAIEIINACHNIEEIENNLEVLERELDIANQEYTILLRQSIKLNESSEVRLLSQELSSYKERRRVYTFEEREEANPSDFSLTSEQLTDHLTKYFSSYCHSDPNSLDMQEAKDFYNKIISEFLECNSGFNRDLMNAGELLRILSRNTNFLSMKDYEEIDRIVGTFLVWEHFDIENLLQRHH